METTFPRFKSFTLAAKLKQKSFVASAALCAEEQQATTISTVIHSRREMNENENNYKVDGLLQIYLCDWSVAVFPGLQKYALP